MQEQMGYRDVSAGPVSLANVLRQSPPGAQLATDGSLVLPIYTTNPMTTILEPANGFACWYDDGTNLTLMGYTRNLGWQGVQLA